MSTDAAYGPELQAIARAAAKAHQWTSERDGRIRVAVASGVPLRTVAAAAGLSHTAVANIRDRK